VKIIVSNRLSLLRKQIAELGPAAQRKVLTRSMVSTARSTRTEAKRDIQLTYNLKSTTIDDKLINSNVSQTGFTLTGTAKQIGIQAYGAKDINPRGVKFAITKGENILLKHGFSQEVSGTTQFFQRVSAARYPIVRLTGPAVASILRNEQRVARLVNHATKLLTREITRLLER
jgi:hypothetical protein